MGGSSPGLSGPQNSIPNPQVALANLDGANNTVPSFITANGPVREARFIRSSNGSLDGGVHGLYTIAGRSDAPGCALAQPNFAQQLSNRNVIFRIPTPVFGLGLVENTPDAVWLPILIQHNRRARGSESVGRSIQAAMIAPLPTSGWKAQNKSLLMFAGSVQR